MENIKIIKKVGQNDNLKKESKIQQEIVMWFKNNYCLKESNPKCCIFSVPNEGMNLVEQMYKKSLGMKAGVSDLIILMKNRIIFIECKDETGKQSEKQKDFEKIVNELGFEYHIVRSVEQLKQIL